MPQRIDGLTMLPPVSLPIAKPTSPAAVAAPGPALDPEEAFFQQPRIHRLAAKPDIVERQRAQAELGDQHGAGFVQTLYDRGIFAGHAIAERLRAVGGWNSRGVQQILAAPRDAVQRSAIFARGDFLVGLLGLLQREVARQRDDAAQLGIELLQAFQINFGQPLGREFSRLDPARELRHRSKCNVLVARGQRAGIDRAADESDRARDLVFWPGSTGSQRECGRERSFQREFARSGAPLVEAAIVLRQLPAATARSAAVISNCTSFSASAKVVADTSGPTGGPAPKAGGAPGGQVVLDFPCWILSHDFAARPPRPELQSMSQSEIVCAISP